MSTAFVPRQDEQSLKADCSVNLVCQYTASLYTASAVPVIFI